MKFKFKDGYLSSFQELYTVKKMLVYALKKYKGKLDSNEIYFINDEIKNEEEYFMAGAYKLKDNDLVKVPSGWHSYFREYYEEYERLLKLKEEFNEM